MPSNILSVREIEHRDINLIIDYWMNSDPIYLQNLGVDINKLPSKNEWERMLLNQLDQAYPTKHSYCIIWLVDGEAIGHCNVNNIMFGHHAFMHLHIWNKPARRLGFGTTFIARSLPYFFNNLALKIIYCEPYALNIAPNKTLEKCGFTFVKKYITTPGSINFEQPVNCWQLSLNEFKSALTNEVSS